MRTRPEAAWRKWFSAEALAEGLNDFLGLGRTTLFLSRWLLLRLVGIAAVCAFVYWCRDGVRLLGPRGVEPIGELFGYASKENPSLARFVLNPSLFWLSDSAGMIRAVAWTGLAAATAFTLNLWPRLAGAVTLVCFVSFIGATFSFTPTVADNMLIETLLLTLPFAPKGRRPGLGRASKPHPLAVLALRLFVLRLLFHSGYGKVFTADATLVSGTLMNSMHETAPFPTFLGYLDHQAPELWHRLQMLFTVVAELGAAVLVLVGRGPRLVAVGLWLALQVSIWLTSNFGPLQILAIGLGLTLVDDQSVLALRKRLWPRRLKGLLTVEKKPPGPLLRDSRPLFAAWCVLWSVNLVWATIILASIVVPFDLREELPRAWSQLLTACFAPSGRYTVYTKVTSGRLLVELAGTDDDGRTWKPYHYKYVIQDERRMVPPLAPYFPRFDVAIQTFGQQPRELPAVFSQTAKRLLEGNAETAELFAANPFPRHAPQAIRFSRYRLSMTDLKTYGETGRFWTRQYVDEAAPVLTRDPKTGRFLSQP